MSGRGPDLRTGVGPGRLREVAADRVRHLGLAALVAGLLLGAFAPPASAALAAVAVVLAAAVLRVGPAAALGLGVLLIVGALAGAARLATVERSALGPELGREVRGPATIVAPPRTDDAGRRRVLVRFRDEPVLLRPAPWGPRVDLEMGAVVTVEGRLRPPDRAARALRAHATLQATGIVATGSARGGMAGVIDAIRRRAERALRGDLPPPEAALARGMVLGQDDALPADLRDAFRAAGLAHLVAASGQNVMLLAALALALGIVAGLGVRARWWLVAVLIALYVPLAGAGPSIQRAGIMGAATVAAALAGRPASRGYALLLAAAATLALDPRAVTEPGWQLSFAAVGGIALLSPSVRGRLVARGLPRAVAEAVAVTSAATLATAPLMAAWFGQLSLVGLPANVLAAPAVAPVMWLGMSAAAAGQVAPALAAPILAAAGLPLGYLVALGRLAGGLPAAQVAVPALAVTILTVLVAFALWRGREAEAAGPGRPLRRRHVVAAVTTLAAAGALASAARPPRAGAPPEGTLRITALDVGQGDATLVQAGGHAVLVDAGPPGAPVTARLRAAGARALDALVVTHPQADHEGGAPAVLRALPTRLLLDGRGGDRAPASRALAGPLTARRTRVVAAAAGQVLEVGPLRLRILWPPPGTAAPGTDPNERAVVAVASAYGARALLTADAESDVLGRLRLPRVDVLKVSHHGSADAGLPGLLQRLRPRAALIEVGRHNTYGHPAASTLRALTGVPYVGRTDRDGTIAVDLRGGGIVSVTTRP